MGDLSHDLPFDTSSTSSTHHLIVSRWRSAAVWRDRHRRV